MKKTKTVKYSSGSGHQQKSKFTGTWKTHQTCHSSKHFITVCSFFFLNIKKRFFLWQMKKITLIFQKEQIGWPSTNPKYLSMLYSMECWLSNLYVFQIYSAPSVYRTLFYCQPHLSPKFSSVPISPTKNTQLYCQTQQPSSATGFQTQKS